MRSFRKRLKWFYLRVVTAKGAPQQVAGGLAVGIFWGMSPLWGLQTVLAFVTATIFNLSRIPAVVAVHSSNIITALFIYSFTWKVGNWLLSPFVGAGGPMPLTEATFSWRTMLGLAGHALARMLIGGFLVGAVLGVITYFLALFGVIRFRRMVKLRSRGWPPARPPPTPPPPRPQKKIPHSPPGTKQRVIDIVRIHVFGRCS